MRTIIAQSGAGKTTWCKTHKWCLDGDNLPEVQYVYRTMRVEYGDDWLADDFGKAEPRYVNLMQEAARKLSGRRIWVAISSTLFANNSSIFVIPGPGVVSRQLSKPRDGHDLKHDQHRAKYADADRKTYIAAAKRMHCLVFTSFDDLSSVSVL